MESSIPLPPSRPSLPLTSSSLSADSSSPLPLPPPSPEPFLHPSPSNVSLLIPPPPYQHPPPYEQHEEGLPYPPHAAYQPRLSSSTEITVYSRSSYLRYGFWPSSSTLSLSDSLSDYLTRGDRLTRLPSPATAARRALKERWQLFVDQKVVGTVTVLVIIALIVVFATQWKNIVHQVDATPKGKDT